MDSDEVSCNCSTDCISNRVGKDQRQIGRIHCRAPYCDNSGDDLASNRRTTNTKNCQSFLVYLLVRAPDTSNVLAFPCISAEVPFLASTIFSIAYYPRYFYYFCLSPQAIRHRFISVGLIFKRNAKHIALLKVHPIEKPIANRTSICKIPILHRFLEALLK